SLPSRQELCELHACRLVLGSSSKSIVPSLSSRTCLLLVSHAQLVLFVSSLTKKRSTLLKTVVSVPEQSVSAVSVALCLIGLGPSHYASALSRKLFRPSRPLRTSSLTTSKSATL